MLLFPLLAGAGVLALLMATGRADADEIEEVYPADEIDSKGDLKRSPEVVKEATKKAVKAAKEKNWQEMVAQALASGSAKVVKTMVNELLKNGQKLQAKDLEKAFAALQKIARDAQKKKAQPKPVAKPAPKSAAKPAPKPTAKPAPKPVAKTAPKPAAKTAPKPVAKPKPAAKPNAHKSLAEKMSAMLLSSSRYKEDQGLVKQYQSDNGLGADGKYGPGTAKSLWDKYKIVPPNPYYWPSTRATEVVSAYKNWLTGIKAQASDAQDKTIDQRLPTVGR